MHRVLKQDGWAIINVPVHQERATTFEDITINDPKKQLELFGQPDHVRIMEGIMWIVCNRRVIK
jgi:hypothetical protein